MSGAHTLSAYVTSGGGAAPKGKMTVSGYGSAESKVKATLPVGSTWTVVSLPFEVSNVAAGQSNGSATIGFMTQDAAGGFWTHVDDVQV